MSSIAVKRLFNFLFLALMGQHELVMENWCVTYALIQKEVKLFFLTTVSVCGNVLKRQGYRMISICIFSNHGSFE